MVDVQTIRKFRVEGTDAIAVKEDHYVNGPGKKVVRVLEEHDITLAEMDEVINKLSNDELVAASNERAKVAKQRDELEKELKDLLPNEEDEKSLAEVKTYLESEKVRKCMTILNKQKGLKQGEAQIAQFDKDLADIVAWKEQMEGLKAEYLKVNPPK